MKEEIKHLVSKGKSPGSACSGSPRLESATCLSAMLREDRAPSPNLPLLGFSPLLHRSLWFTPRTRWAVFLSFVWKTARTPFGFLPLDGVWFMIQNEFSTWHQSVHPWEEYLRPSAVWGHTLLCPSANGFSSLGLYFPISRMAVIESTSHARKQSSYGDFFSSSQLHLSDSRAHLPCPTVSPRQGEFAVSAIKRGLGKRLGPNLEDSQHLNRRTAGRLLDGPWASGEV